MTVAAAPTRDTAGRTGATTHRRPSPAAIWLLAAALGIALVTVAFELSRSQRSFTLAHWLVWVALAIVVGTAAWVLFSPHRPRGVRVTVVAGLAAFLYLVKVLHDPTRFGFADEFVHLANAQAVLRDGGLYAPNRVIAATEGFPGLPAVTALLSSMTGLGLFTSGLVLIGVARVMELVALFLLVEYVTGSERYAGVTALLYCGAPNFVFFESQFAYESLGLPLLIVTLLCVVARQRARPGEERRGFTIAAALLICATVVTHHLTSYALVAILWIVAGVQRAGWTNRRGSPWDLALFGTVVAVTWLFTAAASTQRYLGSIFSRVWRSLGDTVAPGGTRAPFEDSSGTSRAVPVDDRVLAFGAVLLLVAGIAVGLWIVRRSWRRDPVGMLLVATGPLLLVAYALRVVPGAWETANRSTNYVFAGAALLSSFAGVNLARRGLWQMGAAVAASCVIVAGGVVIGWPEAARLPRAWESTTASGGVIEPQTPAFAEWAVDHLPRDANIVADETAARLLLTSGYTRLLTSGALSTPQQLNSRFLQPWVRGVMLRDRVDYVVFDTRRSSANNLTGYFYRRPEPLDPPELRRERIVRRKLAELPGASRIYSSGDIVVYDLRQAIRRGLS